MMFPDDQIVLQESEEQLEILVYCLYLINKEYNTEISITKTKTMAFRGKYPVRTKTVIGNHVLEEARNFNYLGCDVSYNQDEDVMNKLLRFQGISRTIKRQLKNKTRRQTQLKFHKVMAVPMLFYGSETDKKEKRPHKNTSR
jgi:hypothetical protein